ncbi:MAG: class II histone deacetylase [Halolamina sp.]
MSESPDLTVYYDDVFLEHAPPSGAFEMPPSDLLAVDEPHPDRRERIQNVRQAIRETLDDLTGWPAVTPATDEQLERVHDPAYLAELREHSETGGARLTRTTAVSEKTYEAARHAAGAAIQAAEQAASNDRSVPYALVRPSGHHAQPAQADGFCYVNNVAVAAEELLRRADIDRIAILDWDVHPGNGTQEIFYDRDDVVFLSLHNDFGAWGPSHPQTCRLDERGTGDGEGYTVNIPLPPGTGDAGYDYAFKRIVEPVVSSFDPDLVLVSAGQDPGQLDPTARNLVTKAGFENLGQRVRGLADAVADGRLAIVQEGGYQYSHLAFATLGVLEGVLDYDTGVEDPWGLLEEYEPPARDWVDRAVDVHAANWPVRE